MDKDFINNWNRQLKEITNEEFTGTGQICFGGKTHIINSKGATLCETELSRFRPKNYLLGNDRYDLLTADITYNCKACFHSALAVMHPARHKFNQFA